MSDSPGYSSPRHFQRTSRPSVSGSPRPSVSSPLVRAHWPWTTYVQQRPTSAMSSPASTSAAQWEPAAATSVSSHSWQSVTPTSRPTLQPAMQVTPVQEAHGIRQWSFSAFEWTVPNVRDLKKFVESQQVASTTSSLHSEDSQASHSNGIPTILRETPMVGDGKFKLEISRVAPSDEANPSLSLTPDSNENGSPVHIIIPSNSELAMPTALSLCLTSLQLDFLPDCEIATTIMAGIKADADFSGQRGARTEWVWETWEDFVFRKGSEFWECNLPELSVLLQNPRISTSDSFTLSIQLHTPAGPHFPQQPQVYYVPKDLLDGLEASLDNSNTGDVQFICLERFDPSIHTGPEVNADPQQNPHSPSSSPPSPAARKRMIYAHSDILVRRSEYFAALITSSFRESAANPNLHDRELGRTMHTIVVEEADFVTIYWLLKYLYCDWLLFREDDDPRAAVDGMGAGWNARWLSQGNEWEWKTFSTETGQFEDLKDREDDSTAKSVTSESVSGGSIVSDASRGNKIVGLAPSAPSNRTPSRSGNSSASPTTLRPSSHANTSISRRPGKLVTSNSIPTTSTSSARSPTTPSRTSPSQGLYYPMSPSQSRLHAARQVDPHSHPTTAPPAASALSVYQIAHRYRIPGLQHLALEHMMNTISPRSSFPLLLATCFWDELHGMVQDYIVEHWQEVSRSEEFEVCCQEVAAGEWGPEGGKTLAALFRRLHSPTAVRFGSA